MIAEVVGTEAAGGRPDDGDPGSGGFDGTARTGVDSGGHPDWMSTDEAAHRLGVATKTVYRLIDRGELRAFRIGRVIRLKSGDVEAYEASCEIRPGSLGHLHLP